MARSPSEDYLRDVLVGVVAAQAALIDVLVQQRIVPKDAMVERYIDLCDRFGPNVQAGTAARMILRSIRDERPAETHRDPSWFKGVVVGGRADPAPPDLPKK